MLYISERQLLQKKIKHKIWKITLKGPSLKLYYFTLINNINSLFFKLTIFLNVITFYHKLFNFYFQISRKVDNVNEDEIKTGTNLLTIY